MGYRLGEVTTQTGLSAKQVRDWERHGLVRSTRGPGNQRIYELDDIKRLGRAKRMRDAALSLAEIKYALAILDGSAAGNETGAVAHVRTVLARIRTQLDLADELTEAIRLRLVRRAHGGMP